MSATEEKDLKAGHLPAEKAGGMRIVQKNKKQHPEEKGDANGEVEPTPSPPKSDKQLAQKILISGALAKEENAFPPEAVKVIHEKTPVPVHEKRPTPKHHQIVQPRKN